MKKTKKIYKILISGIVFFILCGFLYQTYKIKDTGKKTHTFDPKKYVAVVDNEGIFRKEYEKKLTFTNFYFNQAHQNQSTLTSLKKEILSQMIDLEIIRHYAKRQNLTVTKQEVENRYLTIIKQNKSKTEFLEKIKKMYDIDEAEYKLILAEDILKEKVQAHVGKGITPWLQEQRKKASIQIFFY